MNRKTKGQKLFLLLIISVVCIFAFCMAGCHVSCFNCDLGCNYKDGNFSTGIKNSCDSCGAQNSCGIGAGGYFGDEGVGGGIRFLADSVEKKDTNALFANGSFYTSTSDSNGCSAYVGIYTNEDGSYKYGIDITDGEPEVSCGENSGSYLYRMVKTWINSIFR